MTFLAAISAALTTALAVTIFARLAHQPARSLAELGGHQHKDRVPRRGRLALIGTLVVVGLAISPTALAPTSALIAAALILHRRRSLRRRQALHRRVAQQFPDAVDLFVVAVRAGFLPAQALRQVSVMAPTELRAPLGAVCQRLDTGDSFCDALSTLRLTVGTAAHSFIDALTAADRYGLPLSPVLERIVADTREQRRRDGHACARELPVRLAVPLVTCTLPSFALLAIAPLLLGALSSLHF